MEQNSNDVYQVSPPSFANRLLSLLVPKRIFDNIIGDLEEEFHQRAKQNLSQANKWYWQQATHTSFVYLQKKLSSVEVLGRLNFYLPITVFLVASGLIAILSNLDDPAFISPTFWDELLQGQIHTALMSDNFWGNFWSILRTAEWMMFVHLQSMIIAIANIVMLVYLYKKQQASALKLALWGYTLACVPYAWSIIHIANHSFTPQQIGPIVATGVISLMYMMLPVSYIVHRKLKRLQAENKAFDKQQQQQENLNSETF